jgi:hypothetical protein
MKQTAVEWLLSYLPQIDYVNDPYYKDIIKEAKEMEKKQIIDALRQGVNIELGINEFKENYLTYTQNFDRYYNLKYGKNEKE